MSKNVVTPKSVSFEDALRNLASRLTGQPAAKLPRTQEGIVQFMAENVPSFDEMAEAITMEVFARLVKTEAENPGSVVQQEDPDKAAQEAHAAPCGLCRQFLYEFNPELEILLVNKSSVVRKFSLSELLPVGFGPANLAE